MLSRATIRDAVLKPSFFQAGKRKRAGAACRADSADREQMSAQSVPPKGTPDREYQDQLGVTATDLLRIMWNWPWWAQEAGEMLSLPVAKLSGIECRGPCENVAVRKRIAWWWGGQIFELRLDQEKQPWEDGPGVLTLFVDSEPSLCLRVFHSAAKPYPHWQVLEMLSGHLGDWIDVLEDCAGVLRGRERELRRAYDAFLFRTEDASIERDLNEQLARLREIVGSAENRRSGGRGLLSEAA